MNGSNRKRTVELTEESRVRLEAIPRNGTAPAKKILYARVLLMSDQQHPAGRYPDDQIAAVLGIHVHTVARIRTRFVLQGKGPALERKLRPAPPNPPKLDGRAEATLVALCCSAAPQGQARWTLRLLPEEMVGRKIVTSISQETIRQALKKTCYSLGVRSDSASRNATRPGSSPRWSRCSMSTPNRRTTRSR
jgi:hypothetical protein